jgi:hypothetical protein
VRKTGLPIGRPVDLRPRCREGVAIAAKEDFVSLASQRTRAYQTSLDVRRGFFVGFTYKNVSLNVFVFNPGRETPTVVSSLAVSF